MVFVCPGCYVSVAGETSNFTVVDGGVDSWDIQTEIVSVVQ